jgi:hypothetical protein
VQWRALRSRGRFAVVDFLIVAVLAALALPGHLTVSLFAASQFGTEELGLAPLVTEGLLILTLFLWIMLPAMVASVATQGGEVSPVRLLVFPLSMRELLTYSVAATFLKPVYWVLIALSLATLIPLTAAPRPIAGLAAGILFVAACALFSWALSFASAGLLASRRGREVVLVLLGLSILAWIGLAQINFSFESGSLYLEGVHDDPILLTNSTGTDGALVKLRNWTPAAWAIRAATGPGSLPSLGLLAGACLVGAGVVRWGFRRALTNPIVVASPKHARAGRSRLWRGLRSPVGAGTVKEIRYLTRTPEPWAGIAMSWGATAYLFVRDDPTPLHLAVGLVAILAQTAIPMNSFGLDRAAADRYRIFPLTGREVMWSKNLAYFLVVFVQILPLCASVGILIGPALGIASLLGFATFVLSGVLLGNEVSVRVPAPRQFFHFASKEHGGGILPTIYMAVVWLLPAGIGMATFGLGGFALVLGQGTLLAVAIVLYRPRLALAGAMFDSSAETMRQRLAV